MESHSLNKNKAIPPEIHIHIEPIQGWVSLKLKEFWAYRELLYFFIWRDIKVRYKQTILGISWAILQPLFTMVIFSLFFGNLAKMPSDNIPYPIFSYAALVPWTYFAGAISLGANSLISNPEMLRKIYFPRLTMPGAAVLAGLLDFMLSFIILIGMMIFFGYYPTLNAIWLPFYLILTITTALGVSMWLSAMNVQFRDVRYVISFLIQAWLFATPVIYPSSLLSEPWNILYYLNPMAGVVDGFRWALLGTDTAPGIGIVLSTITAALLFMSGIIYFRRMENTFADII